MRNFVTMRAQALRSRSDEGAVLVTALAFVVLFALLSVALFSVVSNATAGNAELGNQQARRITSDNVSALAVTKLRRAADPTATCTNLTSQDLFLATSSAAATCSMMAPPAPPPGSPASPPGTRGLALLSMLTSGTGLDVEEGFTARIDGDVWINADTSPGDKVEAKGDILVRGFCPSPANLSEATGDNKPVCAAGTMTAPWAFTAALPNTTLARTAPTCASFPVDTKPVVILEAGVYTSAAALNQLFTECNGREFWFKPGTFIFDFQDAGAAHSCGSDKVVASTKLLCMGGTSSRVVGGDAQGWNPEIPTGGYAGPWDNMTLSNLEEWANPGSARSINTAYANVSVGVETRGQRANNFTSAGTPAWSSAGSAGTTDNAVASVDFPTPVTPADGSPVVTVTSDLVMSNFQNPLTAEPISSRLVVVSRVRGGASAEVVLSGTVNCTYPLPSSTTLTTANLDVSACVNTQAKANGLVATVRARSSDSYSSGVDVDSFQTRYNYRLGARTINFDTLNPATPADLTRIRSASLKYNGQHQLNDQIKMELYSGATLACPPITVATMASESDYNITSCLEPSELANLRMVVTLDSAEPSHKIFVDGVGVYIDYERPRTPAPGLGQGCNPAGSGVRMVFRGESRMAISGGETTMCTATTSSWVFSWPNPTGCMPALTCPALTTDASLGKLSLAGGIYAPTSVVSVGDSAYRAPLTTKGFVAGRINLKQSAPAPGYTGPWITASGFVHDDFTVSLATRVSPPRDTTVTHHSHEVIEIGSSIRGRQVKTLSWKMS